MFFSIFKNAQKRPAIGTQIIPRSSAASELNLSFTSKLLVEILFQKIQGGKKLTTVRCLISPQYLSGENQMLWILQQIRVQKRRVTA